MNAAPHDPLPRYHGLVPPLVTPLRARDTLDEAGLERLLEHVLAGGVHGVFLLGTTGEGPGLSYRLRRDLVARACRHVAGRVPVLVGITDTAFEESLAVARHAAACGADAVVAAPPYYFPEGQPELAEYLERLVPELPLPLFLYNMPALTKVSFEGETLRRAMDLPGIIGLKDSSGNLTYFHHAVRLRRSHRPDWTLLMGPEELLADAVWAGGHGGVCGGANLWPRLYVDLFEAARAGDFARADTLRQRVLDVGELVYRIGRHPSALIKGLKCALAELGICDDALTEPFHRFREPERERVRAALRALGLLR
jgi:4-hydroxy-tetrahydrodipicolinate synthase